MTHRKGDWIQTYSGRQFWPLDPLPEEIDIEDIAHALSMQCRFSGHCLRFYSVAEHSVLLSLHVPPEDALWALLHDATEAYLVDVPRPLKPFLAGYKEIEAALMQRVCDRFGLPPAIPASVHEADYAILSDEMAQNMAPPPKRWDTHSKGIGATLRNWDPPGAEQAFLNRFAVLEIAR